MIRAAVFVLALVSCADTLSRSGFVERSHDHTHTRACMQTPVVELHLLDCQCVHVRCMSTWADHFAGRLKPSSTDNKII